MAIVCCQWTIRQMEKGNEAWNREGCEGGTKERNNNRERGNGGLARMY